MPTYQPFDWYETPLFYDIVFDEDTHVEAGFLETMNERYGTGGRKLLEPACGSGRLLHAMAERGWAVTGFDLSPGMLRFAKQRLKDAGLRGRATTADMAAFDVGGGFDLAHCLVSTFKYLRTEDDARGNLECVADALQPGGVYVLGLHICDYDEEGKSRERWVARRGRVEVTCNIQAWPADRQARTEEVRSRLIVREGRRETRYETSWTFRTYDFPQLQSLIRSVPAFEHVATFDFNYLADEPLPFDGGRYDNVLVLRKV
ncbi:MAG: class I SAM-dependent methyltransferase [Planctomycetota bacterium]|jgi:SAM-dependent methyltransferase